jgi:hypothetical protein
MAFLWQKRGKSTCLAGFSEQGLASVFLKDLIAL